MKDAINIVFATNLKRCRIEKKLSQRELAKHCSVDNADISRMENGLINVTINTLEELAGALDINEWELLVRRTNG